MKDTFEIGVGIHVLGIKLGNFYGNLKDGLRVQVKLLQEKGTIRFYVKNGNEVWQSMKLSGISNMDKDVKLFSF
jgi:hypothetical protein